MPRRLQGVELQITGRRGFDWQTHRIDGFDIYVEPGSCAAGQVPAMEADLVRARSTVLA